MGKYPSIYIHTLMNIGGPALMQRVALITKHEKARWIAPYLAPLGYEVFGTSLFDTDILGTFSGAAQ